MSGYFQTLIHSLLILFLALALDLAAGGTPKRWHPAAWMGRLIACPGFLVEAGDARTTWTELRHRGILAHGNGSSGLLTLVRVAARVPGENGRLVQARRGMVDSRPQFEREGMR